jgi:HEAT repeat protein
MEERLQEILVRFGEDPKVALQALRGLHSDDREAFRLASLALLRERYDAPEHRVLARLLAERDQLAEALCDPATFPRDRAIEIAREAMRAQPLLDARLAGRLPDLEPRQAEHVLAILDAIAEGPRVVPMIRYLLRHTDARLRSKATLLIGRAIKNPEWLEQQLREPNPRVRANAVEAFWGVERPGVQGLLQVAARDPNLRVAVNALVGLYRLGDPACLARLRELASCQGAPQRASAAWAMGVTGDPRFLSLLRNMNPEPPDQVGHQICRACERIEQAQAKRSGRLYPLLGSIESSPENDVRLDIAIAGHDWELLDLKSTQFIVWQGTEAVETFTVRPPDRQHALALGFALCGGIDVSDADLDAALDAVQSCLAHKRPNDSWAFARHFDQPVRFTTDRAALKASLRVVDASPSGSPTKTDLLTRLAERATAVRGDRHLVALAGPKGFPAGILPIGQPDPDQILAALRAHKCVLHAVLLGRAASPHPVAELAAKTGGFCLQASSPADQPDLYRQLACGLLNRYQICFRPAAPAGPLRLQVFSDQALGEVLVPDTEPRP